MSMSKEKLKVISYVVNDKYKAKRQMFCKRYQKTDESSSSKILLVYSVPPFCDEENLKQFFSNFAPVELVRKHSYNHQTNVPSSSEDPKGYQTAYVEFKSSRSIDAVLRADQTKCYTMFPDSPPVTGFHKWCTDYVNRIPDASAMKTEIDQFMTDYDRVEQERKRKAKAMKNVPDEDGWITVSSSGRKPLLPSKGESSEKNKKKRKKAKSEQKDTTNFYSFQIRDSKLKQMEELQAKFQEDKKRIELMRASRKFRPY